MTDSSPLISVVIPGYRQAEFIDGCLDSVAAQSWDGPLEVVVVDDGSPDDLGRRAREHPLRPTVIQQSNQGVAAARNRGIAESSGRWIAFLDADDRWTPKKLARQMEAVTERNRPALSFTRYRRVDPRGEPIDVEPDHPPEQLRAHARKLLRHNFIGTSTVLVHRSCIQRCGGFPETEQLRHGGQDYALWLRIAAYFPLVYVPEFGTEYTVHDTNRVGTDPVGHHRSGLEALVDFYRWDPTRFRSLAAGSPEMVATRRLVKFIVETIPRLNVRSPRSVLDALEATITAGSLSQSDK